MTDTPLTPIEVLTLVGLSDRPRYGYELVERIGDLSEARIEVRPGNLYRVIHRLLERGLVTEAAAPEPSSEGPPRQYFQATPEGRRVVARELEMYAGMRRALARPGDAEPATGEA